MKNYIVPASVRNDFNTLSILSVNKNPDSLGMPFYEPSFSKREYERFIEAEKPKTNIRKVMPSIIDESAMFSMEENYQGYIVGDIVTYTNAKCRDLVGHRAKVMKVIHHGKYEVMFLTGHGLHKPKTVVYQELTLQPYKNLIK